MIRFDAKIYDSDTIIFQQNNSASSHSDKTSHQAKQLHEQFENKLSSYEIGSKYVETTKEVIIYTYDSVTKEIRENEANVKKQMSLLKSKIATIEERFAIGKIDNAIYQKFKTKYGEEQESLQLN